MKRFLAILALALLGFAITSVANDQKNETIAPRAMNRKIVDTLKNATLQKMENGKVLTINTWERSCAVGGFDNCDSGTYTTSVVI